MQYNRERFSNRPIEIVKRPKLFLHFKTGITMFLTSGLFFKAHFYFFKGGEQGGGTCKKVGTTLYYNLIQQLKYTFLRFGN